MEYAIELLQEQLRLLQDDIKSMLLTEEERRQTALKLIHVVKALNKLMVKPTRPISELTKEDAIQIANACVSELISHAWRIKTNTDRLLCLVAKDKENIFFVIYKNSFDISLYGFDDEYGFEWFAFNAAKATDKARELGYDV